MIDDYYQVTTTNAGGAETKVTKFSKLELFGKTANPGIKITKFTFTPPQQSAIGCMNVAFTLQDTQALYWNSIVLTLDQTSWANNGD